MPSPGHCSGEILAHGGGLNGCGCHFNRKTGECHCHQPRACGCPCQPSTCR
ncbi:MAG: YHYH domain-containing protein [Comamonadaceae bacterium]|nr:MAG: YHYH domain-containing protein [Comamonadaceae bacterium]